MIGRPMDVRVGHVANNRLTADFDYDDLRPTLRLTLLQLLSLLSVLLLLLLVYGLRSLRLKLFSSSSLIGKGADREALGITRKNEKGVVDLLSESRSGWWLLDAVMGSDEEERVHATAAQIAIAAAQSLPRLPSYSRPHSPHPLSHAFPDKQPVYVPHRQPPLSMAKLIMFRHVHPLRRPRSPAKSTPQNSSHVAYASRPQSPLASTVQGL